jgi:hypothetical protein
MEDLALIVEDLAVIAEDLALILEDLALIVDARLPHKAIILITTYGGKIVCFCYSQS